MGLVEALQHGRQQRARPCPAARAASRMSSAGTSQISAARSGGYSATRLRKLVEADGVRRDVVVVDPAVADDLVQQRRSSTRRWCPGSGARCTVACLARPGSAAGRRMTIAGGLVTGQPVQHAHPQHRLGLGDVVAEQGDDVGVVDVGVRAGLPSQPKVSLSASAAVAVHSRVLPSTWLVPIAALRDHGERVVLLEEQLAGRVEAECAAGPARSSSSRLRATICSIAVSQSVSTSWPFAPDRAARSAGPARRSPASRTDPSDRVGRG